MTLQLFRQAEAYVRGTTRTPALQNSPDAIGSLAPAAKISNGPDNEISYSAKPRGTLRTTRHRRTRRCGAILAVVLVLLIVSSLLLVALLRSVLLQRGQARRLRLHQQAIWLADSAMERAAVSMASNAEYFGESWSLSHDPQYPWTHGEAVIDVDKTSATANGPVINVRATVHAHSGSAASVSRKVNLTFGGTGESP